MKEKWSIEGWAVVPDDKLDICSTSAPAMIGGGTVWQIYKTSKEAKKFCAIPFKDAKYRPVKVHIEWDV